MPTDFRRPRWIAALAFSGFFFGVQAASALTVNVFPNSDEIAVCPAIYGANFPNLNPALSDTVGFTHARWGGNRATRYNYQTYTACSGGDHLENGAEVCDGLHGNHVDFITDNVGRGKLAVIPSNRFDGNAPPGSRLKSTLSTVPNGGKCLNYPDAACDQEFQQSAFDGFVNDVLARDVREFEIDNEPVLWPETHNQFATPPLRPLDNTGLIEMEGEASRRIGELAIAAGVAPGAFKIWAGAFYGGWDLSGGFARYPVFPSSCGPGCFTYDFMGALCNTPATGVSFHWYPEIYANGCRVGEAACEDNASVTWGRVNASRELWQEGFTASNAAQNVSSGFANPHVIPWLKQLNAAACPTKNFEFAITEWRMGKHPNDDVWSAGLGTLDFLAGMARAGVAEAHHWDDIAKGDAQDAPFLAFQLLRAPGGTTASAVGGADGGIMVSTDRITDESLRAYAYKRSDGAGMWVLLLNINHNATTESVTVQFGNGVSATGTATVYGLDRVGPSPDRLVRTAPSNLAVSGSSFTVSVPSGARLIYLPQVSGARAVAHNGCGPVSSTPPSGTWTASATHTPSAPSVGQSVTAAGMVHHTFGDAQTVHVQTLVKDAASGSAVGQTNCENVTIPPNVPYSCSHVATYGAAGNYKIEVGVFSTTWALQSWTSDADVFTVGNSPTGSDAHYGFEGSVQGWQLTNGQASAFQAFSGGPTFGHGGAYALQVQSANASTVQIAEVQTAPLPSSGDTVMFFLAASNPACIDNVKPFVQFGPAGGYIWIGNFASGAQLPNATSDQWLEIEVPIIQGTGQVARLGIETNLNAGCTNTSVYVDDVTW